jgi:hypothetical protein
MDLTQYTVKKRLAIFPPPAGISLINLSLAGNTVIEIFPARESLIGTSWLGTTR